MKINQTKKGLSLAIYVLIVEQELILVNSMGLPIKKTFYPNEETPVELF